MNHYLTQTNAEAIKYTILEDFVNPHVIVPSYLLQQCVTIKFCLERKKG